MSIGFEEKEVKVHKANKMLQAKVGTGPLDEQTVKKCQDVIDNNTVDFSPLALEYLDKLEAAIHGAESGKASTKDSIQNMTSPVMQLKANASTFKYHLIGRLANVMLSFLEAVEALDSDVITIVKAHHQTLKAIVLNKMSGDGGTHGKQMEDELKSACQRYFAKRK